MSKSYYDGRRKKENRWDKNMMENVDKQLNLEYGRYDTPSDKEIEYFINEFWNKNEKEKEDALKWFFTKYHKSNDEKVVFIKVSILNDIYSTQLSTDDELEISKVLAQYSERLSKKEYDESLVSTLCDVICPKIKKTPYSFVTKYCSHQNEIEYPMYDGYVEIMLKWYRKKDKSKSFDFNDSDLTSRDYNVLKRIIVEFKDKFEITKTIKEIDEFLWTAGKKFFPEY